MFFKTRAREIPELSELKTNMVTKQKNKLTFKPPPWSVALRRRRRRLRPLALVAEPRLLTNRLIGAPRDLG